MLELAVQGNDAVVWIPPAVGAMLAAFFAGLKVEQRRNGRRNNPGPDADDYRTGKRGSDCKPGLGKVCREHGEGISDNRATIAAIGADMETYQGQVVLIFKQLGDIQRDVTTLVARQDMPQSGP